MVRLPLVKFNPYLSLSPLPLLAYWPYAKWFQTRPRGGHAIASYASLSMGDYLRETPYAVILSLSTMDPVIAQKHFLVNINPKINAD